MTTTVRSHPWAARGHQDENQLEQDVRCPQGLGFLGSKVAQQVGAASLGASPPPPTLSSGPPVVIRFRGPQRTSARFRPPL